MAGVAIAESQQVVFQLLDVVSTDAFRELPRDGFVPEKKRDGHAVDPVHRLAAIDHVTLGRHPGDLYASAAPAPGSGAPQAPGAGGGPVVQGLDQVCPGGIHACLSLPLVGPLLLLVPCEVALIGVARLLVL